MQERVNYNEISNVYDTRYSGSPLEGVGKYLRDLLSDKKPFYVLEAGCGTGHWLYELAKAENVKPFGLDFSTGMLNQAKKLSPGLNLVNADANQLPLIKESFDLIIVVNAIHHFIKPFDFIHETRKILKPEGIICIIGFDPRESKNDWYLYRYFESTYDKDLQRYPTFDKLMNEMQAAGFFDIKTDLVHQINIHKKGKEILSDHFLDKRGASQLALLSDEEYQIGIDKINSDINHAVKENKELVFETKINFRAITGKRL